MATQSFLSDPLFRPKKAALPIRLGKALWSIICTLFVIGSIFLLATLATVISLSSPAILNRVFTIQFTSVEALFTIVATFVVMVTVGLEVLFMFVYGFEEGTGRRIVVLSFTVAGTLSFAVMQSVMSNPDLLITPIMHSVVLVVITLMVATLGILIGFELNHK